jgi:glycosyltransferase involved in cell wall biosynthesis
MPLNTPRTLFLHAPNVHTGGGFTLLQALYSVPEFHPDFEHVDARAIARLPAASGVRYAVRPTLLSRFVAELRLWRQVAQGDVVLCFHGLAPLLPLNGEVIVFLQNRILLSRSSLRDYALKTRLRLWAERLLVKSCAGRVKKFIVQTPSMKIQASSFLGPDAVIVVCPFVLAEAAAPASPSEGRFDFVYVASAEPHKNHQKLLDAWCQLAQENVRPSLALTIPKDSPLALRVSELVQRWQLNVVNLGVITQTEVLDLYDRSAALIYPSVMESLGLPLLDARARGLPILAAELDYVRDIVVPAQTFDPSSPVSIARAVRRHMGIAEVPASVHGPEVFLEEVLR